MPNETEPDITRPVKSRRMRITILLLVAVVLAGVSWAAVPFQGTERWTYRKIAEYPHDRGFFTQGLVIHNGELIEGTGQFGESRLMRIDLKTGAILKGITLPDHYFGEGIALANGELFQLTWKNRVVLVYDPTTLELKRTGHYTGEGWGLTFDGTHLIMSDGSAILRYYDPTTFRLVKRISVRDGRKTVSELNELEFIRGEIWANIWHDDQVVRIDPSNGRVLGWIDLGGLKPGSLRFDREAVYNGIAYDESSQKLYVTGKNWPSLFEIEVTQKN